MSGNEERTREYRVNIHPNLRGDSISAVCPFCGHFGPVIDVEIVDVNRFIIYCSFCRKSMEVKIIQ